MKKTSRFIKFLALWIATCLCAVAIPALSPAEGSRHPAGYTVRAVLPENQLAGTTGYFHLLMKPLQKQMLEIEVTNHLTSPITLSVDVRDASTNANGLIVYTENTAPADTAAQADTVNQTEGAPNLIGLTAFRHDLLQTGPQESVLQWENDLLTLAPLATVRLPFEIAMSESAIDGQVLGGIVLSKPNLPENTQGASAMTIASVYSYAIAVLLQSSKDISEVPEFELVSVAMTKVAGLDAITATIRNTQPIVASGASLSIQFFAQGAQSPSLDLSDNRVSMAPLTEMPFTCTLPADTRLAAGPYTVRIELTYNGEAWIMEEALMI